MAVGLAFVDIVGDTSRTTDQVERDMARVLATVEDELRPVEIQAAVDNNTERDLTREINQDLRAVSAALQAVRVDARLDPEARGRIEEQLQVATRRLRAARAEIEVRVDNRPIIEETTAAVVEAVHVAEAVAPPIEIETRVDDDRIRRVFSALTSGALGAGKAVAVIGAATVALAGASKAAALLVADLQAMAPAAALAAPAIVSVGLAVGTVKLATAGVSDAITAAFDPKKAEKLTESLKGLAPSAREFVLALQGLKPELKDIQQGVQQRFFEGFGTELQSLAKSVLPAVQAGLFDTASSLNLAAKGASTAAQELGSNGTLGKAIRSAIESTRSLSAVPGLAVTAFGQLAAAAGPSLEKLSAAVADKASTVQTKLAGAFESGALQGAIEQAVALIGQLGHVTANVGRIFNQVFSVANSEGGSFIQTLSKVTDQLVKAFASPAVQSGLQALFSTMSTLSSVGAPLLGMALGVVAEALTAVAPGVKVLVESLGTGLRPIISALGPVLLAVGQAVTQLLFAFSPLLPVIGSLVAQIGPILVPIINTLALEFQRVAPLVQELATIFGTTLTPILQQIPTIMKPFLDAFVQMITILFPFALQLLQQLEPSLNQLSQSFADIAIQLAPVLTQLFSLAIEALQPLLPLIPPIIGFIGQLAAILAGELARQISTVVVPALRGFSQLLNGDVDGAIHSFRDVAVGVAEEVVRQFILLPFKITEAFLGLGAKLFGIGNELIGSLVRGMVAKVPYLTEFLHGLTDLIPKNKGPMSVDRTLLTANGIAIMDGLISGIASRRGALQSELSSITGMISGTGGALGVSTGSGAFPSTSAAAAFPGGVTAGGSAGMSPLIQVFLGTREIEDIVDTRVVASNRVNSRSITTGTRA